MPKVYAIVRRKLNDIFCAPMREKGRVLPKGQSSEDHTVGGIVQNAQLVTFAHHFPSYKYFQRQASREP